MILNPIAIIFVIIGVGALLFLPRRWAPLPLLSAACYMTMSQGIVVGPFHFTIVRVMIVVGLARALIRGERLAGGMNGLDWLMLIWASLVLASSFFQNNMSSAFVFRLGFAYNVCGIYFLIRIFCHSIDDTRALCAATAMLLFPIAVAMFCEKIFQFNIFSVLGGTNAIPAIREGKVRAVGPFAHPILAGTVGAACIPIMLSLWSEQKKTAIFGLISCLMMVLACTSSGPIMSATAALAAMLMWHFKQHMKFVRWFAVITYIAFDIIMKAPAYYLIARFDLVGGSTGWHRAALIETAINHIDEWWLWGTDYTRHWMATGVYWSEDHIDITNYYLQIGIIGGLPLMLLFIAILWKGFAFVGRMTTESSCMIRDVSFLMWSLGASLFVHSVTFISVSYVDQSFIFIYLILALIGSAWSSNGALRPREDVYIYGDDAQCYS